MLTNLINVLLRFREEGVAFNKYTSVRSKDSLFPLEGSG